MTSPTSTSPRPSASSSCRRTSDGAGRLGATTWVSAATAPRVYEQVLREGTEDDVRHFVRLDELVDLWDELVLPDHVRGAWDRWFEARADAILC